MHARQDLLQYLKIERDQRVILASFAEQRSEPKRFEEHAVSELTIVDAEQRMQRTKPYCEVSGAAPRRRFGCGAVQEPLNEGFVARNQLSRSTCRLHEVRSAHPELQRVRSVEDLG